MSATVLIVDDDAAQLANTESMLANRCNYRAISVLGGRAAIERFLLRQSPRPDIILLDLVMPDVNGVEVVRAIRRCDVNIPIVVLYPPDKDAMMMSAIQAGANDCLRKPVNLQFMKITLDKLLQREEMREELCRLSRYGRDDFRYDDVVGESDAVKKLVHQVKEISGQSGPVCFEGEAGTGKELLARVMHRYGVHSDGDFVALPCRATHPFFEAMMAQEYELMRKALPARFSTSQGGTLFLRHIDSLPMQEQEALADLLLRARSSLESPWLQVRFVASCLEPLDELYRLGRLHEKLYFYFSSCVVPVLPVRERMEDIPLLCTHYLKRFTATQPCMVRGVSDAAKSVLQRQFWSGNVTELISLMQRASYLTQRAGQLEELDLLRLLDPTHIAPSGLASSESHSSASIIPSKGSCSLLNSGGEVKAIEQLEAEIISFAIEHYGGKMTEVARKLGIGRSTLYRKMQDYKLRDVA